MRFEFKQWQLSLLVFLVLSVAFFILVNAIFGTSFATILNTIWNALVYVFFTFGLVLALPWAIGFFGRYWVVEGMDYTVEEDNNFGWFVHTFIAIVGGAVLGGLSMFLIKAMVAIPALSQWPWEMIRWPAFYETYPWGWGIYIACAIAIGYGIAAVVKSDE